MPIDVPAPQSALGLVQGAANALPGKTDYAHPLLEKYIRAIASGQMDENQAHAAISRDIQAQQQPLQAAPVQAPQQPQSNLGAMPQQPQQPQPVRQAPPMDASLAGPPPIQAQLAQPQQAPAQPAPQPQQQAAPQRQPEPQALPQAPLPSPGNVARAPSRPEQVNAAQNQMMGSVTSALPVPQRTVVQGQDLSRPQAPQGAQAARRAMGFGITGDEGPRMTNRDAQMFMDAYAKGGKPQIEALREQGKMTRAQMGDATKRDIATRKFNLVDQATQDKFEQSTARLSLDQQREADKVAMFIQAASDKAEALKERLALGWAKQGDAADLKLMEADEKEMLKYIGIAGQMASSINAEDTATMELIASARKRAGEVSRVYEAMRNTVAQRRVGGPAPARDIAEGTLPPAVGNVKKTGPAGKK